MAACGVLRKFDGSLGHLSCSAKAYSMRSSQLAMQGRGRCNPQLPMAGLMHSSGESPVTAHTQDLEHTQGD